MVFTTKFQTSVINNLINKLYISYLLVITKRTKQKNKMKLKSFPLYKLFYMVFLSTVSTPLYFLLPKLIYTIDNSGSQFHRQNHGLICSSVEHSFESFSLMFTKSGFRNVSQDDY